MLKNGKLWTNAGRSTAEMKENVEKSATKESIYQTADWFNSRPARPACPYSLQLPPPKLWRRWRGEKRKYAETPFQMSDWAPKKAEDRSPAIPSNLFGHLHLTLPAYARCAEGNNSTSWLTELSLLEACWGCAAVWTWDRRFGVRQVCASWYSIWRTIYFLSHDDGHLKWIKNYPTPKRIYTGGGSGSVWAGRTGRNPRISRKVTLSAVVWIIHRKFMHYLAAEKIGIPKAVYLNS